MGKNLLVGVGSKARKVKALYVGVGGKARKVKKCTSVWAERQGSCTRAISL